MAGIVVRPVSEGDFPEVCIFEQRRLECPYQAAVFVRQAMVLWPDSFLVAEQNGYLVGFLICSKVTADPQYGWVIRVQVSEDMRRKGVATAMLHHAHETMQEAGVCHMMLSCSPDNESALALYSRMGYRVVCHETGYFGIGEDRVILRKDL
ncbi:MAG: GNAT family N-acetyltransferase [Methanobacteriota archaeon]